MSAVPSLAPMLAFLQYLFAFVILVSAESGFGATPRIDTSGILLVLAGFPLAVRVVAVLMARSTGKDDDRAIRRLLAAGTAGRIAALLLFHLVAGKLGGVLLPLLLGVNGWFLVPRLVQLVPYFALVAGLAWGLHPASAASKVGARTGRGAVADEFRQSILPLSMLLLLLVIQDLPKVFPAAAEILRELPALQSFLMLAVMFAMLLATPFLLRLFIRAKPMPAGPLRDRFEAYSRRVGLRYRDILVWPTDAPNAAVVGVLPRFRYVLVTDSLLGTLGDDELEAVFAHEAGHARRGHIPMFLGFTSVLGLLATTPGVAQVVGLVAARFDPLIWSIGLVLAWFGVVFGWVSRRFEQEADVYGIETLPLAPGDTDPAHHPFGRALERIGAEVGGIREVTGWRHFSIADRVEFVRRYLTDASVRRSHRNSILLLRAGLLAVIGGFWTVAAVQIPGEIRLGLALWENRSQPETNLLTDMRRALDAGDPGAKALLFLAAAGSASRAGHDEDAARWVREAVAVSGDAPVVLPTYALILEKAGRPLGARFVWEELADDEKLPPASREEARRRAAALSSK